MTYPEHEKQAKVVERSQAIGEFLEWLQGERGITLAQCHTHTEWCYDEDGDRNCDMRSGELAIVRVPVVRTLAAFFDIDLDKIDAEKEQMLDELRKGTA